MDFNHQFYDDRIFLVTKLWWLKFFGYQAFGNQIFSIALFLICHIVALPFTLKNILNQNKIMEISIFYHAKINLKKKSSKRNRIPSRYHNSIINPKFQHKPKYHPCTCIKRCCFKWIFIDSFSWLDVYQLYGNIYRSKLSMVSPIIHNSKI
jgi:hypothetical protein